jgi:hypothetical protein
MVKNNPKLPYAVDAVLRQYVAVTLNEFRPSSLCSEARRQPMRTLLGISVLIAGCIISLATASADESCKAQAADKKLAGAAQTSFMTKCEKDAKTACDAQAVDKKLSGAAKDSFTKKCIKDAVGT